MPATSPRNDTRASSLGLKTLRPSRLVPTRATGTAGQNNHYGRPTKPKTRPEKAKIATGKLHLERAMPATSSRNDTHVLVHWESYLQRSENPAAEPARVGVKVRARAWTCARLRMRMNRRQTLQAIIRIDPPTVEQYVFKWRLVD